MSHRRSSRQRFGAFRAALHAAHPWRGQPAASRDPDAPSAGTTTRGPASTGKSTGALLRAFLPLLRPYATPLTISLGLLTLSTLATLIFPATPKFAIDYILTDQPGPTGIPSTWGLPTERGALLVWLAVVGGCSAVAGLGIDVVGRWQLFRVSKRLAVDFRRKVFRHAVQLPLWRVHALKSGGVASVLRNDAGTPAELLIHLLYYPWRSCVQLLCTFVILAFVDWFLLVCALGLLPVVYMTHRTWIRRIRPVYRGVRDSREAVDAHAAEVFGGMRVVRAFGNERHEARRFVVGMHVMTRQEIFSWWWSRMIEIGWRVVVPLASLLILLYGGTEVIRGALSLGDLVLFVTYTGMLLGPLENLVGSASSIQSALAGFERIEELLDEPDENRALHASAAGLQVHRGAIELDEIAFVYPNSETPVLQNVTLRIDAGQTVALVGPSGAGKTTLSNLIARFYAPTAGSLRIDGVEASALDLSAYRAALGIVEQEVFLFDGSIRDNIAYAKPTASDDEVREAAQRAYAHRFIVGFPAGYDTEIGERGVRLSGGQKQRLALARAILRDPKILILDEATSNLDAESEAVIQKSLVELMHGRTSIVIAHRLSTIRHADRIVVLDEGRVVETGTHEELLARGGRYAEFLRTQLEPARAEARDEHHAQDASAQQAPPRRPVRA